MIETAEPRSRWGTDGWALYAVLALACVFSVWIPIAISLAYPIKLLDGWGVLSGYVGVAWVTPGVLAGLAVGRLSRERGAPHPNAIGAVAAVVILAALVIALAAWMTTLENRWEESGSAARDPKPVVEAPAALVRSAADEPVLDVVCRSISDGSFFCAATYPGPSCQLWSITSAEARALPIVAEGARAARTDGSVRCAR